MIKTISEHMKTYNETNNTQFEENNNNKLTETNIYIK